MGSISDPVSVLPITGILYRSDCTVEGPLDLLVEKIGPILSHTTAVPFTHTAYYGKEMGEQLMRQWYAFDVLMDPAMLISLKHMSNEIEQHYSDEQGNRCINIDPGIVTLNNLILASTKNYAHRIYLGQGIYAEVTLLYRNNSFHPLEWTYPDYREPDTLAFFTTARSCLKEKLGTQHGRHDV